MAWFGISMYASITFEADRLTADFIPCLARAVRQSVRRSAHHFPIPIMPFFGLVMQVAIHLQESNVCAGRTGKQGPRIGPERMKPYVVDGLGHCVCN